MVSVLRTRETSVVELWDHGDPLGQRPRNGTPWSNSALATTTCRSSPPTKRATTPRRPPSSVGAKLRPLAPRGARPSQPRRDRTVGCCRRASGRVFFCVAGDELGHAVSLRAATRGVVEAALPPRLGARVRVRTCSLVAPDLAARSQFPERPHRRCHTYRELTRVRRALARYRTARDNETPSRARTKQIDPRTLALIENASGFPGYFLVVLGPVATSPGRSNIYCPRDGAVRPTARSVTAARHHQTPDAVVARVCCSERFLSTRTATSGRSTSTSISNRGDGKRSFKYVYEKHGRQEPAAQVAKRHHVTAPKSAGGAIWVGRWVPRQANWDAWCQRRSTTGVAWRKTAAMARHPLSPSAVPSDLALQVGSTSRRHPRHPLGAAW